MGAYIVLKSSGIALSSRDLRNSWTHNLHGYLIPQEVLILEDKLPRDDQGNVDEELLPSLAPTSRSLSSSDPLQAAVVEVRCDVMCGSPCDVAAAGMV